MAKSKQLMDEEEAIGTGKDLTLCGICLAPIENPKALPCLHTFCLGCIEEWTSGKMDTVKCPQCKEEFPLPPGGVPGLRSNIFVTKLKETQGMKDELASENVPCTCCKKAGNVATARCTDCKEYLCSTCVEIHRTLGALKGHKVYSFDDIRSGKIDADKMSAKEYCNKHGGQVLWFFCETCGVLICRDCTVVDHPASKHTLVNVEDNSGDRAKKMKELSSRCQAVAQQVDDAIKVATDVDNDLTTALQKVSLHIAQATAKTKDNFLLNLQQKEQELIKDMTQIGDHNKSEIKVTKDTLMSQRSQLKRALDMTAHVTENGSPYDLAAMYTPLTDTLQKLSDIKPKIVPQAWSEVKFLASPDHQLPKLGTVTVKQVAHDVSGEWEVESQFGQDPILQCGMSIAVSPTGDIAVADNDTARFTVFNPSGQIKHHIHSGQSDSKTLFPRSVVFSSDGTTYVTDWSGYVKVFDTNAKFVRKFEVKAPPTCTSKMANLSGMAVDINNQLIVGEYGYKYISIHSTSGSPVSSFTVPLAPWFISAAEDTLLVANWTAKCALIVNYKGQILHTLGTSLIPGKAWSPTGAHFITNDEFLIVSENASGKPGGIYHYSTKGEYLGQIAKEVTDPVGVTITRDGKLLVLKRNKVELFKKKK